jgi:hypothetical protein
MNTHEDFIPEPETLERYQAALREGKGEDFLRKLRRQPGGRRLISKWKELIAADLQRRAQQIRSHGPALVPPLQF